MVPAENPGTFTVPRRVRAVLMNPLNYWVVDPFRALLAQRKFWSVLFVLLLAELGVMTVAMGAGRSGGVGLFLLMVWSAGGALLLINGTAGILFSWKHRSWVLMAFSGACLLVVLSILFDLSAM